MKEKTEEELKKLVKENKYQVFVCACRAHVPFNFAFHAWFVVNNKGKISRWEIRHNRNMNNPDWGYLYLNNQFPFQGIRSFLFSKKYARKVKLVGYIEGDENSLAQKVIEFIEKSQKLYPYCHEYLLTGPNSNTYAEWIFNKFPEFNIKLPWSFVGKNYKIKE